MDPGDGAEPSRHWSDPSRVVPIGYGLDGNPPNSSQADAMTHFAPSDPSMISAVIPNTSCSVSGVKT